MTDPYEKANTWHTTLDVAAIDVTIPVTKLGGFIRAFQDRFPSYSAFPRFYMGRGQSFRLFVAKSEVTCPLSTDGHTPWLTQQDYTRMVEFAVGYRDALANVCKKKTR